MPNTTAADNGDSRAARMAMLEHLTTWIKNEGAPAPSYISVHHTITPRDEADQATRLAAVDAFAAQHGLTVHRTLEHHWATVQVYPMVSYSLFADLDTEHPL